MLFIQGERNLYQCPWRSGKGRKYKLVILILTFSKKEKQTVPAKVFGLLYGPDIAAALPAAVVRGSVAAGPFSAYSRPFFRRADNVVPCPLPDLPTNVHAPSIDPGADGQFPYDR